MLDTVYKRRHDESGFTLIELLVVILIIGVLSAIAMPLFLNQARAARAEPVKGLGASIEEWLTANPDASVPVTDTYVAYESFREKSAANGLKLPVLPDGDDDWVKIVKTDDTADSYIICKYNESSSSSSSRSRTLSQRSMWYDSTTGEVEFSKPHILCD